MNWATIDPGYSTGVAIWQSRVPRSRQPPLLTSLVRLKNERQEWPWYARYHKLASLVVDILFTHQCTRAYCEIPEFFQEKQVHSVMKLGYYVGCLAGRGLGRIEFIPIPVKDWKGQLPKEYVERRIRYLLGQKNCRDFREDIWDAVGIGLHIRGHRMEGPTSG